MKRLALALLLLASCGDERRTPGPGGGGDSKENCGGGEGYVVSFCRQVDHYERGIGRAGQDTITIDCIVGPQGATVSNAKDGPYFAAGSYRLTNFSTAEVRLGWGGTTEIRNMMSHSISQAGEGSFQVSVDKISGGEGNLFLSVSSESSLLFDTVPVDTMCPTARDAGVAMDAAVPQDGGTPPTGLSGQWNGSWHSNSGPSGSLFLDIVQSGNNFQGELTFGGTTCATSASIQGTLNGSAFSGTIEYNNVVLNITGTTSGSSLSGAYVGASPGAGQCGQDQGTFTLTR